MKYRKDEQEGLWDETVGVISTKTVVIFLAMVIKRLILSYEC